MKQVNEQTIEFLFLKMAAHFSRWLPQDPRHLEFMKSQYYEELKDYSEELIFANLKQHIRDSSFMPTVADLVKKRLVYESVPDANETKLRIDQEKQLLLSNTRTEEEEKEIKEILRKHKEKSAEERYNEYKRRVIESKG